MRDSSMVTWEGATTEVTFLSLTIRLTCSQANAKHMKLTATLPLPRLILGIADLFWK